MKLFQKLVCMALTATATASLSICAFAADYTFDTAADTDYYPSTSYEDTYGTAYHYGSKNLVDYQIPELPYGVLSTTQTGVMEKLRLPGLQQTVGGSASGIYGVDMRKLPGMNAPILPNCGNSFRPCGKRSPAEKGSSTSPNSRKRWRKRLPESKTWACGISGKALHIRRFMPVWSVLPVTGA